MEADILTGEIAKLEKVLRRQFTGALPQRILDSSLTAAARVVVKQAKRPDYAFSDRTGKLRRTIKAVKFRGRGSRRGGGTGVSYTPAGIAIGGEGARQGVLIELGTEKARARAPLRRAIAETGSEQVQAMRRKGNDEMAKYVRELNSGVLRPTTRRALAR